MHVIYVGDSRNIVRRIRSDHCGGNVEASALRRHLAAGVGYGLRISTRLSGSRRSRLDLPDPRVGEAAISRYLRAGLWRFVICASYDEASDFQWYVIDRLCPILNVDRKAWDRRQAARYSSLLGTLTSSAGYSCSALAGLETGPGVYVLYHAEPPQALMPGENPG